MASQTNTPNKKSCCWLGHSCWLKCVFGLIVVAAGAGLYWKHMQIERQMTMLSSQLQKGTPGQLQTQLDTVELLLNMANVHLKTLGEKNTAASYLQQAKQQIQLLPETPEQRALQQALSDDIQTVTLVEVMPLETVSTKLDALIEQSREIEGALPSKNKPNETADKTHTPVPAAPLPATTPPATAPAEQKEKDWQEKLHAGWTQIKDLVKSEDKGASDNTVEALLIPAKLGIKLEEIKLAAFYRDNDFFHRLVNQTIDWLGDHYDLSKNEKALSLKNELEAMKNWNLTPNTQVLSKSMAALNNLKQKSAKP